jgi:hypothetical protein
LTYRDSGASGSQFDVLSGDVYVARISKRKAAVATGGAECWNWHFFSMPIGPLSFAVHGQANSLDEAKAGVESNWKIWMDAAGLIRSQCK